jgi:hypothetical protein
MNICGNVREGIIKVCLKFQTFSVILKYHFIFLKVQKKSFFVKLTFFTFKNRNGLLDGIASIFQESILVMST